MARFFFKPLYIRLSRRSHPLTWETALQFGYAAVWRSRSEPRAEECLPEMERQREARGAERVNPPEERSEASSKEAKVRWRHAILMERGRESVAGRGEEETLHIGV